ncbi:MAG: hypothetical protein IIB65_06530, partial [Proteobacteria bacterium]|nr:hypothetical protein [Pseudomonadota bacterium]
MFRKDRFVEDCKSAVADGQKAVRELVLEAVADPSGIVAELGEPTKAGVYPLCHGDDLTVINFVWAPYMTLLPHNHNMFAVVGIYSGREDNMFWRRIDDGAGDGAAVDADRKLYKYEVCRISRSVLGGDAALEFVLSGDETLPDELVKPGDRLTGVVGSDPFEVIANLEGAMSEAVGSIALASSEVGQLARQVNDLIEGN